MFQERHILALRHGYGFPVCGHDALVGAFIVREELHLPWVFPLKALDHLEAMVMRAIVENDDFKIPISLVNNGLDGLLEQVGPVVIGDDDADGGRIHLRLSSWVARRN